jgi:Fur family transcriptional regulator, ferric uptake regulator
MNGMMTEPVSPDAIDEWLACLQNNGYRITEPRRAVIETIASSQHVLNPFDVFELARIRYPKLGLVTVYRTIEKLEELDLVQRVHRPSDCQAFIAAFSGHQHLLICQQCGRVEFFSGENERMDALIQSVSEASGYQIKEHWLQLFGLCRNCRAGS